MRRAPEVSWRHKIEAGLVWAALDPALDKRLRVKIYQSDRVLCPDLGIGCEDRIFYERQ